MKSTMKRNVSRVLAVFLCSTGLMLSAAVAQQDAPPPAADAQQQGPPPVGHRGWDPERRAQMLQRRLDLSQDQTTQVRAIFVESRAKMEALRANTSLSEEDRRSQFASLRQDQQAKVRGLLTPDQQAKFDRMLARRREHRNHHGENDQAPTQPQQ